MGSLYNRIKNNRGRTNREEIIKKRIKRNKQRIKRIKRRNREERRKKKEEQKTDNKKDNRRKGIHSEKCSQLQVFNVHSL